MNVTNPDYYPPTSSLIVGDLPYWRGAAVKYLIRAGKKSADTELDDLRKAADCIRRELARLGQGQLTQEDIDALRLSP